MVKKAVMVERITVKELVCQLTKEFEKVVDAKLSKLQAPPEKDPFITRQDVAKIFHISVQTVHSWMNAGVLKPYKIGNTTLFLLSEVKAAALNTGNKKGVANA